MNTVKSINPCVNCGQERVASKTWVEWIPTFSGKKMRVEHTNYICPNPACQKEVDKDIKEAKDKKDKIIKEREERAEENRKRRSNRRGLQLKKTA